MSIDSFSGYSLKYLIEVTFCEPFKASDQLYSLDVYSVFIERKTKENEKFSDSFEIRTHDLRVGRATN